MTPNKCKCGGKPEVGANYTQVGNLYSGYYYVKCTRCGKTIKEIIKKILYLAEQKVIEEWNKNEP